MARSVKLKDDLNNYVGYDADRRKMLLLLNLSAFKMMEEAYQEKIVEYMVKIEKIHERRESLMNELEELRKEFPD